MIIKAIDIPFIIKKKDEINKIGRVLLRLGLTELMHKKNIINDNSIPIPLNNRIPQLWKIAKKRIICRYLSLYIIFEFIFLLFDDPHIVI